MYIIVHLLGARYFLDPWWMMFKCSSTSTDWLKRQLRMQMQAIQVWAHRYMWERSARICWAVCQITNTAKFNIYARLQQKKCQVQLHEYTQFVFHARQTTIQRNNIALSMLHSLDFNQIHRFTELHKEIDEYNSK